MAQLVLPRVHTMVICDGVEESEYEAEVFDLSGVRALIESPFPAVVSRFCVFLHMTGHEGSANCHIEIERATTKDVILESNVQVVSFVDPTVPIPVVFRFRDCVFPEAGLYYVQVFHDSKMIGERPFRLLEED